MGYVGCVSSLCLSSIGHNVTGVDVNPDKINSLNNGISPIIENGLPELLKKSLESKNFSASLSPEKAIENSDVIFVCVGTPSCDNGNICLEHIENVTKQIGQTIANCNDSKLVVYRSTLLPGLIEEKIIPMLESESQKKEGSDFYVCFNPEFLREGTAISDFLSPPFTVVGARSQIAYKKLQNLYSPVKAPFIEVNIKTAETIKYANNAFHALKVGFANEIGRICKTANIDSRIVMDIFCKDTSLNLSSYYLKPGFAFGGSCLPKDLRALLYLSKTKDLDLPILESILKSNNTHIESLVKFILSLNKKKIGLFGLSFKPGTDDLRESPYVELAKRLYGEGADLSIYDENLALSKVFGSNRDYLEKNLPHISSLLTEDLEKFTAQNEIIIVSRHSKHLGKLLNENKEKSNTFLIDLDGQGNLNKLGYDNYHGICW